MFRECQLFAKKCPRLIVAAVLRCSKCLVCSDLGFRARGVKFGSLGSGVSGVGGFRCWGGLF